MQNLPFSHKIPRMNICTYILCRRIICHPLGIVYLQQHFRIKFSSVPVNVQWDTIQNGIFAFAGKEISHLPTLTAFQGLKHWSLTMKFLSWHNLYVNYICAKFQGQKVYTKKDVRNLPTCIAVRKISLLPTLTPSQGWKIVFHQWNFWHETISMLIICVKNFKNKRFRQKKIYQVVGI